MEIPDEIILKSIEAGREKCDEISSKRNQIIDLEKEISRLNTSIEYEEGRLLLISSFLDLNSGIEDNENWKNEFNEIIKSKINQ